MERISDIMPEKRFDLFYAKKVLDKLELIRKDKILRKRYEAFERRLEEPYCFIETKKKMPEGTKILDSVREKFRYVELTETVCILYEICEQDSSVVIYLITI